MGGSRMGSRMVRAWQFSSRMGVHARIPYTVRDARTMFAHPSWSGI
jgi:hypothetical protein